MTPVEALILLELLGWIIAGVILVFAEVHGPPCGPTPAEQAVRDVSNLEMHVDMFLLNHKRCPESLDELVEAELIVRAPEDPWGHDYLLTGIAGRCGAASAGPDGRFGTADDVRSWDPLP